MSRGHSVSCADAVRTATEECQCTCQGDFHGGPHTERVRALVWDEDKRETYSRNQVTTAKRKARDALDAGTAVGETCTDFAVTYMIDVFIAATSSTDHDMARETLKAILDPFVEEIVHADLDETESRNIETAVNHLHVICSLCVEILKMIDESKALLNQAADTVAQAVVDGLGQHPFLTKLAKAVLKRALMRSFPAVVHLLTADPATVKMLQMVGFATCPDVNDHGEVEKCCIQPLQGAYVKAALHDWIDQSFPRDADILKRRRRAKKAS